MRPYLMPVVYITNKCNLNCSYCYVKKDNRSMDWKTAKRTIDFLGSLEYERRVVSLFGGEPLVEWGLVKKIVAYIGKTAKFTDVFLCTNGTLLDGEKIKYFVDNGITPQISIDGITVAHDAHRRDLLNRGSFLQLDKNLKLLGKKYIKNMKNLNLRLTITPQSIPYLYKTIEYIISINLLKAQINMMPEVHIEYNNQDFNSLDRELLKIAELARYLRDKNKRLNLHYNECIVRGGSFESMGKEDWSPFCYLADQMLSVDIDGNVYTCYIAARIKDDKKRRSLLLGNIYNGIRYPSRIIDLVYSNGHNPYLSCLVWNYERNNRLLTALKVYKRMYAGWKKAFQLYQR